MRKTFTTLVVLGIFAMIATPVANADNDDPVKAGNTATAGTDGDLVLGSFISNGSCTPGTTNCTNFVTGRHQP